MFFELFLPQRISEFPSGTRTHNLQDSVNISQLERTMISIEQHVNHYLEGRWHIARPGSSNLLRLGEEVTMATLLRVKPLRKVQLVSLLRRLAYRAVDQGAISLSPSRQARNGSLLTLSKLHLLSYG